MAADLGAVTFVAADFSVDDIAAVLGACGHDASSTSLFIGEGLLVYLTQTTIVDLLRGLRTSPPRRTAPWRPAWPCTPTAAIRIVSRPPPTRRRRVGRTEPWQTILPAAEHYALLAAGGWRVETAVAAVPPTTPPKHSQLVTARPTEG